MDYTQYLPYLLPPLLGALIGYVTNYIAIRMLFRPLRAWRIFGIRIPLTPGIIPAKRGELATRMGEMVGDHLLTAADVGRALGKETIQNELRRTVTGKLADLLDRPQGSLATLVPERFSHRFDDFVTMIQKKIAALINDHLAGEAFEQRLRTFVQQQGANWLQRDVAGVLEKQNWQQFLDDRYTALFRSPATAGLVEKVVDRKISQLLTSQRPLRDHLPQEMVEVVLAQVEKELPPLIEKFGELFQDPQFRRQLVKKGQKAIDDFLDSLGGMAGLLSGFIDLKKLYARIPEFLDRAGDELANWLRQEETRQKLTELARGRAEALLGRSVSSYVQNVSAEKLRATRRFICDQAVAKVQSRSTIDSALILTESAVDRIRHQSFADLLKAVMPEGGVERGLDQLTEQLLGILRSPEMATLVETMVREQSDEWIYHQPLGLVSSRLPVDLRRELEISLCHLTEEMLRKEAPQLVETLNVRLMVEDKVNGLDLLQVEDLLMGVMKEQFKYINLFGAVLGFLIGCINLLVLLVL